MDVNVLLFPDFETLDAFGPVEVLGRAEELCLHYASLAGGLVKSSQGVEVMTEGLSQVNASGILLVPGGQGTRTLVEDEGFLQQLLSVAKEATYCLTVCTGSALLAKTGLLEGCRATSNKRSFAWVKGLNAKVEWLNCARWAVDGKFYTSSGISAGMDMALGFVSDLYGRQRAQDIAQRIEYIWNEDKENDPFSY